MQLKQRLCHSVAGICLVAVSVPAMAQATAPANAPEADDNQLGDIIVTARRTSENLQTVPVSVTAFNAQEIINRGARTIEDLAIGTPGVSITPATSTKNAAVVGIRGLVETNNLMTTDGAVGLYVDDIYYARAYAALGDLLDVSGVEVLKGPQGTYYGRNTIGGAIKITTNRADPSAPIGGYFRASYGRFNAVDLTGAVNLPIVKDVLAVRYAASYHKHDGYTHSYLVPFNPATGVATSLTPTRRIDTDNQDSFSQRLSIRFNPTDNFSISAAGSTFRSKDNGVLVAGRNGDIQNYNFTAQPTSFTTSPQRQADFYSALIDTVPSSYTTLKTADATVEWKSSDALTAKLIVGYVETHNLTTINSDGTVVGGFGFFSFQPRLDQRQHQTTAEFQLLGKLLDSRLKYVGGFYYFDEKGSEAQPNTTSWQFNTNAATNFGGDVHNRSKSAFLNMSYSWTDSFRTSVGVRYTWDTKSLDGHTRDASSPATTDVCFYAPGPGVVTSVTPNGPCSLLASSAADYFTYEIGADYRVTPTVFLYAKVGNGQRSGGVQLRGLGGNTSIPFTPDKVMSYEAGVKSELFDRHLRVNLSYYHTDYTNIQQQAFGPVASAFGPKFTAFTINAGSAKVDGLEAEAELKVVPGLTLSGSLGYVDFRFANPGQIQTQTPKWTYQVSANFTQPTSLGRVSAHLSYSGKSSFYSAGVSSDAFPEGKLDGFGLLDGRLSLEMDNGLSLAVFGKNLLDKQYYSQGFSTAYNPGPTNFTTVFGFYGLRGYNVGAPRTFGIEVGYKF